MEEEIGKVTHYFGNLQVAVIEIENGELNVGDTIHVQGATSDFTQKVETMEIDRKPVETAKKGDAIGMKVIEHARQHDKVFVVKE